MVIKDGCIKNVFLQATTYIETNIIKSKEAVTKMFCRLVFDSDGEKIGTTKEQQYTDYIVELIMNLRTKLKNGDK